MSSYIKTTKHPETGAIEQAEWLDDYFGQHNYGVRFPSDGKVFRADEFDWQENLELLTLEGFLKAGHMNPATIHLTERGSRWGAPQASVEHHEDGKRTVTTKHEDGRQDVRIEVTRLNIENRTPEDTIAEEKIIEAMSKKIVRVVVVHKPTNDFASFDSPLPLVRKRAEEVAESHHTKRLRIEGAFHEKLSDYIVVEYDADQIRVSSLCEN